MENKSHALAAGVFVLGLAALFVSMVLWLTRDATDRHEFELVTSDAVSGLQPQAGVRYKGVLVGRVEEIELDPAVKGQIRIQIAVDKNTPITKSTFASLAYQGITGLSFIQLDDTGESAQILEPGHDNLARIPMRDGLVSQLTERGGNLLEKVDLITQNVNSLLQAENQKIFVESIRNLGHAAENISHLARNANNVMGQQTKGEQINLPRVLAQTESTLKSIQTSTERMGESLEAVRTTATEFKRLSGRMGEPGGTLDQLEQSSEVIQFTAQSIHSNLMPAINRSADSSVYAVRQWGRVADDLSNTPEVLFWGKDAPSAGPGEAGFVAK